MSKELYLVFETGVLMYKNACTLKKALDQKKVRNTLLYQKKRKKKHIADLTHACTITNGLGILNHKDNMVLISRAQNNSTKVY